MNINFEDLARRYYKLKYMARYQTSPRIEDETVLEHHATVAALVIKLHDDYEFDLLKAIKIALFHDYGELEISDIPHNIKANLPQHIKEELDKQEESVLKRDLGNDYAAGLKEFDDLLTVEGLIIAYADAYSCKLYGEYQSDLGCDWYKGDFIDYTKKRLDDLIKSLEPYHR
jgi:5'-deoxynucleotidase YfbR-like HD superfamily hydrolase